MKDKAPYNPAGCDHPLTSPGLGARKGDFIMRTRLALSVFLFFLITLVTGCSSMTPRYRLSDRLPVPDESTAALLQIPTNYQLLLVDGIQPSASVRYDFASQAIVCHAYRETLITPGPHFLLYENRIAPIKLKQTPIFLATMEFQPGHTYRVRVRWQNTDQGWRCLGWVEQVPFLMERRKISPGFGFDRQFDYWRNQDWRIVAAAIIVPEKTKEWPPVETLLRVCRDGVEDVKRAFPDVK